MTKATDAVVMNKDSRRAQDIREEIQEECAKIESGYVGLAQKLHETVMQAYWVKWGFSSFEEFCTEELQIGYRRASYLVQIAETVASLKIPWDDISSIGWTKMRTILPALKDGVDVGEWLNLCSELSVKDLEKLVKDHKMGVEINPTGGDALVTLKFRVTREQYDIISDALEAAKKIIELDNDVMALEQIAYDFFMGTDGDTDNLTMETMVAFIEKKFGVEIGVLGRSEIEDVVNDTPEEQVEV